MAHLQCNASQLPTARAVHRHLHPTPVPAPAMAETSTLEERLLAHLDEWMAHHQIAANILAGASVAAFIALTAGAVVASSI